MFKNKREEGFEIEKKKFSFDSSGEYPDIYSKIFNFAATRIEVKYSKKELARLMLDYGELGENDWHRLSLRSVLKGKNIPEESVIEALTIAFDVLVRRKFNNAVERLANRSESLSDNGYFDF